MKRNSLFLMQNVADGHIIVPVGNAMKQFNGIINTNDIGAEIWKLLENDTTVEKLLNTILENYNVSVDIASKDLNDFLSKLRNVGAIEE